MGTAKTAPDREPFVQNYLESISGHIFDGSSSGMTRRTVTVRVRKGGETYLEQRDVLPQPDFNYQTSGWPKPFC
jgi:hypothetical protein